MGLTGFGLAVPAPQASLPALPGTHLYYPVECVIDDRENTNFGIIKITAPNSSRQVVREDGTRCCKIQRQIFHDDDWDALRQATNAYLQAFGVTELLTADSMYDQLERDLIQELGASQADIDAGQWWLTTPLTTVGLQARFLLLHESGDEVGNSIQPNIKTPIANRTLAPDPTQKVKVSQFEKYEVEIILDNDYFHQTDRMDSKARFDACDADHDGEKIIVDARFALWDGKDPNSLVKANGVPQAFDVPGFCMKEAPAGPFKWKARFAPPQQTTGTQYWELTTRASVWHTASGDTTNNYDELNQVEVPDRTDHRKTYYHDWGYNNHTDGLRPELVERPAFRTPGNHHTGPNLRQKLGPNLPIPTLRFTVAAGQKDGPLQVNPSGGFYLQQLTQSAGYRPQPFFIVGAATPWCKPTLLEGFDRENDLLAPMARAKMNFNYTWMAPWETMLAHSQRTEDWYGTPDPLDPASPGGTLTKLAVDASENWSPFSYYDQGRADRLDKIVEAHESRDIYNGLVLWPHDSLWPADDSKGGTFNSDNGLSKVPQMDFDSFFSSAATDTDPRWLWQKNLYRYIVARYGYSRTLAMWIVIAELEGVGPGAYGAAEYWWHPRARNHTRRWHDKVLETLRAVDYRRRIVTSTTAQFTENRLDPYLAASEIPDHGDFQGYDQKVDLLGFSSYPTVWASDRWKPGDEWPDHDYVNDETNWATRCATIFADAQQRIWHYGAARMYNWIKNTARIARPHLMLEFGIVERMDPDQPALLENQVRSYLHFCLWAAFATGHAGTPLKWCDQSRFGALFSHGTSRFTPGTYTDWSSEYKSLIHLLTPGGPLGDISRLTTRLTLSADMTCTAATIKAFGLRSANSDLVVVWVFDNDSSNTAKRDYAWTDARNPPQPHIKTNASAVRLNDQLHIANIPPGSYVVSHYNTWDVAPTIDDPPQPSANGTLSVPLGEFPSCIDPDRRDLVWDGADVLLIIKRHHPV